MKAKKSTHVDSERIPDGGWGWLVAIGGCSVQMLLSTVLASFGVVFAELIETQGIDATEAAWIPALFSAMWCLGTPWASMLSNYYSYRALSMIGALMVGLGLIWSSQSDGVLILYITYGVLGGCGTALAVSQSTVIVQQYFRKRRGMATGIFMAGASLGQLCIPLLLNKLISSYGIRGAILIHGGIALNALVGVSFFQPVEWHLLPKKSTEEKKLIANGNAVENADKTCEKPLLNGRALNNISLSNSNSKNDIKGMCEANGNLDEKSFLNGRAINNIALSTSNSKASIKGMCEENGNLPSMEIKPAPEINGKLEEVEDPPEPCSAVFKRVMLQVYPVHFLLNPVFIVAAISNMSCRITYQNYLLVIPAYGRGLGLSKEESAFFLTVVALTDLIARLGVPAFSDTGIIRRKFLFMGGAACCCVSCLIAFFGQDQVWALVSCALFGCGSGTMMGLNYVLLSEYMGLDNLPKAYGMTFLINGIGAFTITPLMGYLRSKTGDFRISLLTLAVFVTISIVVWLLEPGAQKLNKRRLERREKNRNALKV